MGSSDPFFLSLILSLLFFTLVTSSAIKLNTPSHGSSVSLSNISRVELTGLVKILLKVLCRQLAILVRVPTPDVIIGGVTLVDTTISSAAESAATSSTLPYWSKSSKLCTVTPNSSLTLAKSSAKSVYCKLIKVTSGMVSIGDHSVIGG